MASRRSSSERDGVWAVFPDARRVTVAVEAAADCFVADPAPQRHPHVVDGVERLGTEATEYGSERLAAVLQFDTGVAVRVDEFAARRGVLVGR